MFFVSAQLSHPFLSLFKVPSFHTFPCWWHSKSQHVDKMWIELRTLELFVVDLSDGFPSFQALIDSNHPVNIEISFFSLIQSSSLISFIFSQCQSTFFFFICFCHIDWWAHNPSKLSFVMKNVISFARFAKASKGSKKYAHREFHSVHVVVVTVELPWCSSLFSPMQKKVSRWKNGNEATTNEHETTKRIEFF